MNLFSSARFFAALCLLLPLFVQATPQYLGSESCQSCHLTEFESWQGSHHQLAMQRASEEAVLGDFSGSQFSKDGVTSTFFKQEGRFMINTDGPDGTLQDYEISYVFGVYPLQQYMVDFSQGKIQVLDIAWDSRSEAEGGQRWFSLHPDEIIPAGDVLHWTGPNLNWNYMCADCHSTNLLKNYDEKTQAYQTSWTDINVGCEACHGPGSEHKTWADARQKGSEYQAENMGLTASLNERDGVTWHVDTKTKLPKRSQLNESRAEIEVCARCHSRRSQLSDDFVPGQPFMDAYHPALLTEGLYYPDGQMLDEVYVWGSFRQSKMYQAGVTCSDCHDPHSAKLKAPAQQVCAQCHTPAQYDSETHHFHEVGSKGASCISCHMPASTLMQVDERNDHSFRIPRPDNSYQQGTPNACNQCHDDKNVAWSLEQIKHWYGIQPRGFQRFSGALSTARMGSIDSIPLLSQLAMDTSQSSIARATAFSHLGGSVNQNSMMLIQQGLNDEDPLVRQGALQAMESFPPEQRLIALPAVWDEVRSVRIQAARLLASYPGELREDRQAKLDTVLREYIVSQEFNAERPEAQLNLANLYTDQKKFIEAEQAYRKALQLQARFVPAYVNFAQLLSVLKRDTEASNLLAAGIEEVPESADLHHALGLAKIRQKKVGESIVDLALAAQLAPGNRRYQFVYAVALQSTGDIHKAVEVLEASLKRFPDDPETIYTLVTYYLEAGRQPAALSSAKKLQSLLPDNPDIKKLLESLQH